MNKRSFLLGVGAALVAPAIVRADSLMKLYIPKQSLVTPSYAMFGSTVYYLAADGFYQFSPDNGLERLDG